MDDVMISLQRSIEEVDHEMKRGEVGYYQINRVIQRVISGDLTIAEGIVELKHVEKLLENWERGQPSPFGEIE